MVLALVAEISSLPVAAKNAPSAADSIAVSVRARSIAPGEAVRILVEPVRRSSGGSGVNGHGPGETSPYTRVEGTFLGEALSFAPIGAHGAWSAWAVVGFDEKPGARTVVVTAWDSEGGTARASRTVRVIARRFPTEKLTVKEQYVEPPVEVQERIAAETERLSAVYATRSAPAAVEAPFARPVNGEALGTFGAKRILNGKPRAPHPGIDLRAGTGTPVKAAGPGRVALAGDLYFSGRTVILDHGEGLFTIYAHLSRIDVAESDHIEEGRILGLSGATGRVTGPHLHWGAKIGDKPFDPRGLLTPALFRR